MTRCPLQLNAKSLFFLRIRLFHLAPYHCISLGRAAACCNNSIFFLFFYDYNMPYIDFL